MKEQDDMSLGSATRDNSQGSAPVENWLPIATAPKDGTVILARQGFWSPCHLYWEHGGWCGIEYQFTSRPTHWMPTQQQQVQAATPLTEGKD